MTLIFLFSLTTRMKVKLNESRKLMRIRSQEKARLLHVAMFSIVTCCYRTTTNVFSWVHWWPSLLMLFFVVFAVQMFMLALQSCTTLLTLICYCFISKVRSSRRSVVKATDLHWAKLGSTPAGSHWWRQLLLCTTKSPARLGGHVWAFEQWSHRRLIGTKLGCSVKYSRVHMPYYPEFGLAVWCSGNALVLINAVALHRARLVLGWVTAFGQVNCPIT